MNPSKPDITRECLLVWEEEAQAYRMHLMDGNISVFSVLLPSQPDNPQLEPVFESMANMSARETQDTEVKS